MTWPVFSIERMPSLMKRFTSCSTAISSSLALCSNRPFFLCCKPNSSTWVAVGLPMANLNGHGYGANKRWARSVLFCHWRNSCCARSINRKPHPATTGHALRAYNSNKYWKSLITRYFQGSQFQKGYAPMASVPRLVRDVVFDHQRRYAAA